MTISYNSADLSDPDGLLDTKKQEDISRFRRILPQVLACSAKNLLIFEFGLSLAFPTILIGALKGNNDTAGGLYVTPTDATWLASISFICQPIGSILSGVVTEPLGRKLTMVLVNIPHAISWFLLYKTQKLILIYVAFGFQGFAIGLMEAPIFAYLGEIAEPSTRGPLTASIGFFASGGLSFVFWLNLVMPWRQVAICCAAVPLFVTAAILCVPETPIWLIAKGRTTEALKALQWLRGWTSAEAVTDEYNDLQRYKENVRICYTCEKKNQACPHPPPTLLDKIRHFRRKQTLMPFLIIIIQLVLVQCSGTFPLRPFIIQILETYNSSLKGDIVTSIMGLMGFIGTIFILLTIHKIGKRRMYLCSAFAVMICCFALSYYGFRYLPIGVNSFEKYTKTTTDQVGNSPDSYIPVILFLTLHWAGSVGIGTIPHMLLSELFSFKSRALATGLAASIFYLSGFIATKTYYRLETTLSLPGVFCFYGFAALFGFIAMYLTLPETEKRTLEEIEIYFSDKSRKLFDVEIKKRLIPIEEKMPANRQ